MKRSLSIILILSAASSVTLARKSCTDSCDLEAISQTFLSIHPHFQSNSPEMVSTFRDDRVHIREDGKQGAVQFVVFGGKTTNEDDLARYFFPFGKTSLIVTSDFEDTEDFDIFGTHFNLFTQDKFRSKITIEPEQSVIGVGFHYRQSFKRNEEKNRGFFFSVSTPLIRVKNDLNFEEKILLDGGEADDDLDENPVANMKEAFNQKEWKFGKITTKSMTKTRLADIEVKLGYEWLQHDPYRVESYFGIIIPTGNRNEGEFVFEPIVGYGKHAGVMFGSALGIQIWDDEENDKHLRVEYNTHSQYLFEKTQTRSFDLKNKPWSRYMEVYANEDQAREALILAQTDADKASTLATPGINVFTQKVDVTPGFSSNFNTALVYRSKGFDGEIGYNFFVRRSECVKLACPWKEGPALKHLEGAGQTNPIRDITGNKFLEQQVVDNGVELTQSGVILPDENGDPPTIIEASQILIPVVVDFYEQSIIKEEDLDLQSAATPCMLTHTVYGALGYRWDNREYPLFLTYGGSYTFSRNNNNAVPKRWTIWGKFGFSF